MVAPHLSNSQLACPLILFLSIPAYQPWSWAPSASFPCTPPSTVPSSTTHCHSQPLAGAAETLVQLLT